MEWLDVLAVQGTVKSILQHHSSKASILRRSAFFTVQLSHPYMTTGKTTASTRQTFVVKVMSFDVSHFNSQVQQEEGESLPRSGLQPCAPLPCRRPPDCGRAHLSCPRPRRCVLCHSHHGTRLPSRPGCENTLLPCSAPDQACGHGRCPPLTALPRSLLPPLFQVGRVQPAP